MKKMTYLMGVVGILCLHSVACAATTSRTTSASASPNPTLLCPPIHVIKKNPDPSKSNWTAETAYGLWKSYGISFATNLTHFVGAQWVGEKVGQIMCIYHSNQQFNMQGHSAVQPTLPILLVFHTLTFEPKKGKWQKLTKKNRVVHGVRNCYSLKQPDCPFQMHIKTPIGNVIQQAESLKSDNESGSNQVTSE